MPDGLDSDILQALGRIEGKLDNTTTNISDTLTKVIYALLAILGADIGLNFLPNSPINWSDGITDTTRYLSIFSIIFLGLRMWSTRKQRTRSKYFLFLAFGFIFLGCTLLGSIWLRGSEFIWILMPLRFLYIGFFSWYAWNIEKINGIH